MIKENFAVFILSHGRANRCITYNTLLKAGYTGRIFILIDNEDKQIQQYKDKYGDKVIVFDKAEQAKHTNTMDNFEGRKAIVYARNANFKIAKEMGIEYFLQLDDDYRGISYRYDNELTFKSKGMRSIDNIFNSYVSFLKTTRAKSIAFAQGGDYFGGPMCSVNKNGITLKRKCMNTWFFATNNPVEFVGKMNEDYTASIYYGSKGDLFFTCYLTDIDQVPTQLGAGGMTDIYLDNGTYVKTFYTVMAMPSCVSVSMMGKTNRRLHHKTNWNNAVPKILREEHS